MLYMVKHVAGPREALIAITSGLRLTRAHIERTYGGAWETEPPASATE